MKPRRSTTSSGLLVAGALSLAAVMAPPVAASSPPAGHASKAARGANLYTFTHYSVTSVDGKRFYRVTVAQPRQAPPEAGYPVVYMLDGNSVVESLPHQNLPDVQREGLPLIVAIGDDPDMPENLAARPYDYLPPTSTTEPTYEDDKRVTLAGGADIFLDLLDQTIRPKIESQYQIDTHRQTLWGHSYGGLFALHTMFTRPDDFQSYVAVSPSIRWHESFILHEEEAYVSTPHDPSRLFIMVGGKEQRVRVVNPAVPGGHETVHTSNQSAMAERLARLPWLTVQFREFEDKTHGPMLPASLHPALEWAVDDGASG
jgi:predicted alpha/beta superfamily hydrolase